LTVIAAVLSLVIFKLYAFLILPLVIESTKTVIKKCVKCDHVLDKQELLSLPSLTDNVNPVCLCEAINMYRFSVLNAEVVLLSSQENTLLVFWEF